MEQKLNLRTTIYVEPDFNSKYNDMATYVNEFELLFAQLKGMGIDSNTTQWIKAVLLLPRAGN